MYKALYLSPMVPSFHVEGTVMFFTELFAFSVARNDGGYVILYKENLTLHIMSAGAGIGQMEFYLVVDDIDALWNSIKNKLDGVKVREPFNREYGMREFHVEVPHTNALMFVGMALE